MKSKKKKYRKEANDNTYQKPPRRKQQFSKPTKVMIAVIALIVAAVVGVTLISLAFSAPESDQNEKPIPTAAPQPTAVRQYPAGTDPETLGSITQLVNKKHGLPQNYQPNDLVILNLPSVRECLMRQEAASALEELFTAANNDGIELICCSAFRSYDDQIGVYNNEIANLGQQEADWTTAPAGFSEHQTGLCIDVSSSSVNLELTTDYINTPEGKWLDQNAYKYGYIIRYPNGKENITGYTYEPWHIRYLGKSVAAEVVNSGLTYEEYLVFK